MGEDAMVEVERVREGDRPENREILDFKEYGGLYSRCLFASQAETQEKADNIMDPYNTTVEFDDLTADAMKGRDRNYNFVCEKSSIAERKKQWEEVEYSTAYSQWKKQFTGFMQSIKEKRGEKGEEAFGIIMGGDRNKQAKDFTEADADTLFNKFCKGKDNKDTSDIDLFVKLITSRLVFKNNKIELDNLKLLLPHLQWIASGLFGKETASQAVTRLIELESKIYNSPNNSPMYVAVDVFSLDKGKRINNPTGDEKKVLGALFKGEIPIQTPQAARFVPSRDEAAVVPAVFQGVPQPAPVDTVAFFAPRKDQGEPPSPPPVKEIPASTSGERLQNMHKKELEATREKLLSPFSRKEQDRLGALMIDRTEDQISKMTPQEQERVKGDMEEMLRMDIANLETIIKEDGLGNAQGPTTQDVSLPPPTPAESDLAPAEPTPERISEIGRKEFSLTDRPFLRIPQEERDGIIINVIRAAGGKYGE